LNRHQRQALIPAVPGTTEQQLITTYGRYMKRNTLSLIVTAELPEGKEMSGESAHP